MKTKLGASSPVKQASSATARTAIARARPSSARCLPWLVSQSTQQLRKIVGIRFLHQRIVAAANGCRAPAARTLRRHRGQFVPSLAGWSPRRRRSARPGRRDARGRCPTARDRRMARSEMASGRGRPMRPCPSLLPSQPAICMAMAARPGGSTSWLGLRPGCPMSSAATCPARRRGRPLREGRVDHHRRRQPRCRWRAAVARSPSASTPPRQFPAKRAGPIAEDRPKLAA